MNVGPDSLLRQSGCRIRCAHRDRWYLQKAIFDMRHPNIPYPICVKSQSDTYTYYGLLLEILYTVNTYIDIGLFTIL